MASDYFSQVAWGLGRGSRRTDLPALDYRASKLVMAEAYMDEGAVCWWCGRDKMFGGWVGDHLVPVFNDMPIVAAHVHCNMTRKQKIPPVAAVQRLFHGKDEVIVSNMSAEERLEAVRSASVRLFGHPRELYLCLALTRKRAPVYRASPSPSARGVVCERSLIKLQKGGLV